MASVAGISTLGVLFGYGIGEGNTKPSKFTKLDRVNSIGGISLETESIDASALEDLISRSVAGRENTGGSWEVGFNLTDEVVTQLETMIEAYTGKGNTQRMFFEVWSPYLTKAFYIVAQPPLHIPLPEIGQNELETVSLTLQIEEYIGLDTAIKPEA